MARCLFVVEDCFEISGRGIALLPGIIPLEGESFRRGDLIELRSQTGWRRVVPIAAWEFTSQFPASVLLRDVLPVDAQPGTEVWSVDSN